MPSPRKRAGYTKNPNKVPKDRLRPISVPQPFDMLSEYEELARARQEEISAYTPLRVLFEEAINALLTDILAGRAVQFAPTPASGFIRRTIWIDDEVMSRMREIAKARNLHYSNVVLTALLRYAAKRGVLFEGFPQQF